jgi:hypothetical protein
MTIRSLAAASTAALVVAALPAAATDAASGPAQRRAFFGELHLHTTLSFDAWTFGTKVFPDQAYKFGRGETVMVPAAQAGRDWGLTGGKYVAVRRAWPLDFMAVTDHSEYMGAFQQLDVPDSAFSQSAVGKEIAAMGRRAFILANRFLGTPEVSDAAKVANAWAVQVKAANDNYQPGKFTTLIAYEWSAGQGGRHLHRNVFFNADHAPPPFTSVQSGRPEDLWTYLEGVRRQGIDVIAIPHNSNLSDGLTYDWNNSDGRPIDEAYAQRRALNEPLAEITQNKGTSETRPELSPNDEFANYEVMERLYKGETKSATGGAYIRDAYGRGLVIQAKVGANPFKMGLVAASDIHNGLSTSDENAFAGGPRGYDPKSVTPSLESARTIVERSGPIGTRPNGQSENDPLQSSSGGLTGVWAERNDRASIFAALKRKETFATTGVRIRLRMFSGWGFDTRLTNRADWVATAYATGVPMGGDMAAKPAAAKAPRFAIEALKDPDGANLDRIQIVKVWLANGTYGEKVFDVALSGGRKADPRTGKIPPVGNSVDLKTGAYANTIGATELKAVWTDPTFKAGTPAVYYARVLQIPTPRWSTLLALKEGLPIPTAAPATIQERGWTSPIWYSPPKG